MSNSALSGDTTVISVPGAKPVRTHKRVFRRSALWLGVFILIVWSVLSALEVLNPRMFPSPWGILGAVPAVATSPSFWTSLTNTLLTWLISVGLVVVVGAVLGVVIGSSRILASATRFVVEFFRPIPSVAILPLILLVVGPTEETKIILAVYAGFWPMLIQTFYGIRSTDPVLVDTARAFNLSPVAIARRVVLPSALPYVATGLRLASALTLVLTVTVEIIIGVEGLGREIFIAQNAAAISQVYLLIIVAGFLGLAINELFRVLEARLLSWHQSQRREGL